jgi:hypothetical protein
MDRGRSKSRCSVSTDAGRRHHRSKYARGEVRVDSASRSISSWRSTKLTQAPPTIQPALTRSGGQEARCAANAPTEIPKAPDEQSQQSNDGFLVNGSVNNAATSQYSLDRAFGNRRPNSKSLYNGGLMAILGNSALNARAYSLSGQQFSKPFYNLITGAARWRTHQDSSPAAARPNLFRRISMDAQPDRAG